MRNSLYDALEVNASSSTAAIQAALRTVVRRFWAVPRDASGDSEEAVRFAALAASILVDPVRRKDYDAALNPGVGTGPWRLPIANRDVAAEGGTQSRILPDESGEVSQLTIEATPPKSLPGVNALAEPLPDGTAWASPRVSIVFFATWLLLWYALAQPFPEWFELSTADALFFATGATAAAYALARWFCRSQAVAGATASLSRLAIIKWRREGSIFIGSPPLQHDTAWIFKLRLMELTRSAAGFVTASSPWRRLAARLIDYALIAVLVYVGSVLIAQVVPILDTAFILGRSILVLPTLVALLAIPAAALAHHLFATTPGKWLFGLQLVTAITRPADHVDPSNQRLLWSRATRAAWSGAALGFWPIALYRLPRNLRLARDTETPWESGGDSLVMARPPSTQPVAIGLCILLAASLILASGWRRDYIAVWPNLVSMAASARAALGGVLGSAATAPTTNAKIDPFAVPATLPKTTEAPVSSTGNDRRSPSKSAPAVVSPVSPPPALSVTDADMAKLATASQARRLRIDGYARQAEGARRSGDYGALQGSCQRWTEEQPGSAEAWRCLGLAQFQNGAQRAALPALRRALKIEPNDALVESAILRILRP